MQITSKIRQFLVFSFGLVLLLTPLPMWGRLGLNNIIERTFQYPISLIKPLVFKSPVEYNYLITDSQNYIILLMIAVPIAFFCWQMISFFFKKNMSFIIKTMEVSIIYYLAWIFMSYGFSKIFLVQFPPVSQEVANTLVKDMDIDLLFWTTIGASAKINYILGAIETLCAALLFWQITRNLGLLLMFIISLQIAMINISFDISVKTFSLILVCIGLYFSYHNLFSIIRLLTGKQANYQHQIYDLNIAAPYKNMLKILVIGFIVVGACWGV